VTPERSAMVVRMNRCKPRSRRAAARLPGTPAALTLGLLLAAGLGGCSMMQKADVFDWFGSDDKPPAQADKPTTPDEPYPNLADVPGRPAKPPAIDRDKISQTLAADREHAQYTDDTLRRAPDAGALPPPAPPPASAPAAGLASPAPAPVASAPLAPAASPPPSQAAASPPPSQAAASPPPVAPVPSAPPAQTAQAAPAMPSAPPPAAPPSSAYAAPAEAPLDPNAPPITIVNNRPVVSAGFYGTEPPPAPPASPSAGQAQSQAAFPPAAPDVAAPAAPAAPPGAPPRQRLAAVPPPVAPPPFADVKPSPEAVARADDVTVRSTAPAAAPPPAAPTDIAPIPYAPYAGTPAPVAPASPSPVAPLAALPPGGFPGTRPNSPSSPPAGTPPDRLDQALRQAFPDAAPAEGIDALAATIYFGDGATGLSEDDRAILREVVRLHRERGGTIRVVGYASPDARGGDVMARRLANLEVSGRRADTVSHELGRLGVPVGAITASAEGTPASAGTAGASFGAAGERRVDIYLDY